MDWLDLPTIVRIDRTRRELGAPVERNHPTIDRGCAPSERVPLATLRRLQRGHVVSEVW
jgi:hypothetical protein